MSLRRAFFAACMVALYAGGANAQFQPPAAQPPAAQQQ
jgi:hypothetical protein